MNRFAKPAEWGLVLVVLFVIYVITYLFLIYENTTNKYGTVEFSMRRVGVKTNDLAYNVSILDKDGKIITAGSKAKNDVDGQWNYIDHSKCPDNIMWG